VRPIPIYFKIMFWVLVALTLLLLASILITGVPASSAARPTPFGSLRITVSLVVALAILGEIVAFGFVQRRHLKERRGSATRPTGPLVPIDVKYGVGGGVLVVLGFVVGQALGFATAPASIPMDVIPALSWGVVLSGAVSSPSLGQGLGARPLWIGVSLVLAFALGAAGGLPAIV
jgi:hypothetical protein